MNGDGMLAEMQGLYGAFSFPEALLQKIWLRGDFDAASARLADGRALKVLHPGRWNRLGGPDFQGARLRIGDDEVGGDVELHLRARDWAAHAHAADPAYDRVALHVVLFPCAEKTTRGGGGREIPVLCLLPLLHHGLEEYAEAEAVERLAGRPLHFAQEELGALGIQELDALLARHAASRWRSKVHFARARIGKLGWEGACHHAALEILGYRFNRVPMLGIATARPLAEWTAGRAEPDAVFESQAGRWNLQGVRPLNHPRLRLRQYARWCAGRPDWPLRLRELAVPDGPPGAAGEWRRRAGLPKLRSAWRDALCAGAVGGARFENLVCDGFLPLLAAGTGKDVESVWSGWYVGDAPASCAKTLRGLGVVGGRDRPLSQGPVQGLLGWLIEHELPAARKA